ncbi:MAG: hypothetical protein QOE73_836, partial [Verrucomicrobiota bacterium]
MNCGFCHALAALLGCFLIAGVGPLPQEAATEPESASASIPFSGEYLVEETFVGGGNVRGDTQDVRDFGESDTIVRFVLTPRVKIGVLRLGAEWEKFSFDFSSSSPLPDELQSVSLVVGIDTQLSDSFLVRFEVQPGVYNTGFDNLSDDFNAPFI